MRGVRNSEIDPSTIWHRYDKDGKKKPDVAPDVLTGTMASQNANNVSITGGSITGITDLAVADGGTGASTAAAARTNLGVGTGDSPEFAAVNIGNSADTTVTRTGAGDIAVEGNGIYRAGGTDVPVADGGTGASTAAGARTNLGLDYPWNSWSPTWTNLSVGNGTLVATFQQIGKLVYARLHLTFGSTTSVTGNISLTLPATAATYAGTVRSALGLVRCFDTSGAVTAEGFIVPLTTTTCLPAVYTVGATYLGSAAINATVPFTWATGDELTFQFSFEAA